MNDRRASSARRSRLVPKPVAGFAQPVAEGDIQWPGEESGDLTERPGTTLALAPADLEADREADVTGGVAPGPDDSDARPADGPGSEALAAAVPRGSAELRLSAESAASAMPGQGAHKVRTSDMVPLRIKDKVEADQRRGKEASTIIVLAFSRAVDEGVLGGLVAEYKAQGAMNSPFPGPHVPARRRRGTTTTRLQYNPWSYEDEGIKALVTQYGVSRAVLVSLVLAHYYGLSVDIV